MTESSENQSIVCLAQIADTFEGPYGYLHGGIIATLLDESMSKAVRARGLTAMTRSMEVDYLRPVSSGAPIRIQARVARSETRKHWVEGRILDAAGTELARGKGLFIEVRPRSAWIAGGLNASLKSSQPGEDGALQKDAVV
jgi:uncharacterized protein (TIGR00369 family)